MARRFVKQLGQWLEARRDHWILRLFGQRLMDPQLWTLNRHAITTAFGAGVAISFIPLPVHTVVGVLAALYWRFNLPVVLARSWGVNPFTVGPIHYGAFRLRRNLLPNPPPAVCFPLSLRLLGPRLGPPWE